MVVLQETGLISSHFGISQEFLTNDMYDIKYPLARLDRWCSKKYSLKSIRGKRQSLCYNKESEN